MYYRCGRCGENKELRMSKNPGNPLDKYLALERSVNKSKIVQVDDRGDRALCSKCLQELSKWIRPKT